MKIHPCCVSIIHNTLNVRLDAHLNYLVAVTNITLCRIRMYMKCDMTFEVGVGKYLEVPVL
jgi:hypothetical protein